MTPFCVFHHSFIICINSLRSLPVEKKTNVWFPKQLFCTSNTSWCGNCVALPFLIHNALSNWLIKYQHQALYLLRVEMKSMFIISKRGEDCHLQDHSWRGNKTFHLLICHGTWSSVQWSFFNVSILFLKRSKKLSEPSKAFTPPLCLD